MASLNDSVTKIPGVGAKRADSLRALGIETLFDLVSYYPRAYIDQSSISPIVALVPDSVATIRGVIMNVREKVSASGMNVLTAYVSDGLGSIALTWFNQPFLKRKLIPGTGIFATGKIARGFDGGLSITQFMSFETLAKGMAPPVGALPVYPLTAAINQNFMRGIMKKFFSLKIDIPDPIPGKILSKFSLIPKRDALFMIHFPNAMAEAERARRRLAFEELFVIQCGLLLMKKEEGQGVQCLPAGRIFKSVYEKLPFSLTEEQARTWREIAADMERQSPMRRLVEGDVGSGKTVIAALALVKAAENGFQGAMMAPTDILARQHYKTLTALTEGSGLKVVMLSGKLPAKEREQALSAIENHEADIIVGTHALIQGKVRYSSLGLVITDEQHRFGINARASLTKKGRIPDVLVMTATPIPRTMALTVYGDLDVSRIEELPPGRQPVRTFVRTNDRRALVYEFVKKEIESGRQAYVVCPAIEEGENISSVEEVYDELSSGIFRSTKCGVIYGSYAEKESVMENFYEGRIKLLVATTVIEVGVDVPNASVIVVENADRFGLSTLHQLRGRIGRGGHKSYCILLTGNKSKETWERLSIMTKVSSGFKLAEEDLRLRGPGEFFGRSQHGFGDLRAANVLRDASILLEARRAASESVESSEETSEFRNFLQEKYKGMFEKINDA